MSARLHFLTLTTSPEVMGRSRELCQEFKFSFLGVTDFSDLSHSKIGYEQAQLILVGCLSENKEEAAAIVNDARQSFKESYICVVLSDTEMSHLDFVKNAGANMGISESQLMKTSALEYVASQIIRASYVPVKLAEFPKESVLDFTLYHLMPLNQKLLPILPKGIPLTESRLEKLTGIGEVFVRREEVDRYRHYVEGRTDTSAQGLRSRCRAQYLSFCNSHAQLMFLLIDESPVSSREGKWLYDRCEILSRDLMTTLSAVGEAWEVVNNSSLGEFGSLERAPTISAYAGLLGLLSSIGEPVTVMMAALLSGVGMLDFPPSLSRKMREVGNVDSFTEDEMKLYKKHLARSVERCRERQLPVKERVEYLMMHSHERADGTGFPEGHTLKQIPMEAMLIQFSEMIDKGAIVKIGQPRTSVKEVRKQVVEAEMQEAHVFSQEFIEKLKPVL